MSRYEELREQYVKLAKMTDQRLVRLEKLEKDPKFEAVTKYAYAKVKEDIYNYEKYNDLRVGSNPRFNRNIPTTEEGLIARIKQMEEFNEKTTSTKGKIVDMYERRAKTISDQIDVDLSWQELQQFYELKKIEKIQKKLGSRSVQQLFGAFKEKEYTEEEFKNALKTHEVVVDEVVDDKIRELIRSHRLTYKDFFKY